MKKVKLLFVSLIIMTASCDVNDDYHSIESNAEIKHASSLVDLETPFGAQPNVATAEDAGARSEFLPRGDWDLVWSDEFNGFTLDTTKWNKTFSKKSRNTKGRDPALKDWRWNPDQVYLDGEGKLVLQATKKSPGELRVGSVDSKDLFEPKYGFMEVRMKVAETAKGNHTAFWLQGKGMSNIDGTGNDGAEIDVFESAWVGDYTKSVVHIDGYGKYHRANTIQYSTPNLHTEYHTFGLEWDSTKLKIYYDGVHKTSYHGIWVPHVEEYLWLSVGASFGDGDFGSQPIGLLSEAKVDYVRVWKKKASPPFDPAKDHFRLVNKASGKFIRTRGSKDNSFIEQAQHSQSGDWSTWTIQNTTSNNFYFVNEGTGKYFRPDFSFNGSSVRLKPTSFSGSWTQWQMIDAGNNYVYIRNKQTGKYLRVPGTNKSGVLVESTSRRDDWAKWKLIPAY